MKRDQLKSKYVLIILTASLLGLFIRMLFFNYETPDYSFFLTNWMDVMDKTEGFKRFGLDLGDYTCPYMYILAIITFLPVNRLYAIKSVSCLFDFLLAFFAFDIILTLTKNRKISAWTCLAVFLCPTVIINSAIWGQCDVIYSTFVIGALSFILKDKPIKSCIMYGIAFAIKLQSIFFAPIFICLWLKKKVKIRHLFTIPIIYCLTGVPAIIAGRNLVSLFTVYFRQGSEYSYLSSNAASFWGFARDLEIEATPLLTASAVGFTGLFVFFILISVFKTKFSTNNLQWLELACIFVTAIPFFLPKMHERYFYIADILSIVYAFCHKKRWFVPILSISASTYTYLRYIYRGIFRQCPLWLGSIAMMIVVIIFMLDYYKGFSDKNQKVTINSRSKFGVDNIE